MEGVSRVEWRGCSTALNCGGVVGRRFGRVVGCSIEDNERGGGELGLGLIATGGEGRGLAAGGEGMGLATGGEARGLLALTATGLIGPGLVSSTNSKLGSYTGGLQGSNLIVTVIKY